MASLKSKVTAGSAAKRPNIGSDTTAVDVEATTSVITLDSGTALPGASRMAPGDTSSHASHGFEELGGQFSGVHFPNLVQALEEPILDTTVPDSHHSTNRNILGKLRQLYASYIGPLFHRRRFSAGSQGTAPSNASERGYIPLVELGGSGTHEPVLPLEENPPASRVGRVDLMALFRSAMDSVIVETRASVGMSTWMIIMTLLLALNAIVPLAFHYVEHGIPSQAWLPIACGAFLTVCGLVLALVLGWDAYGHALMVLLNLAVLVGWLSWLDRDPLIPSKI